MRVVNVGSIRCFLLKDGTFQYPKATLDSEQTRAIFGDLPDEVVLVSQDGQETRIPRPRIADIQPGTVSLMPSGLGDQLTVQELADLLAFLKATRWGAD